MLRNDPAHVDNFCEEAAKLYLDPTNQMEASWNKAMQAQWAIIQSHASDCTCRICSIGVEAIPIRIRDKVLAKMDAVES